MELLDKVEKLSNSMGKRCRNYRKTDNPRHFVEIQKCMHSIHFVLKTARLKENVY
jgi:hypothetical protein